MMVVLPAPASPPMRTKRLPLLITSSSTERSRCSARLLPAVRPDLTTDSVVPLTTDTESASVGALAEGGEGAGGAPGVGVDQPAPPGRAVGRGDPGEPVIGGLAREVMPTLLGEDREGVVVCHVSSLGLSPPRHMGQIADL